MHDDDPILKGLKWAMFVLIIMLILCLFSFIMYEYEYCEYVEVEEIIYLSSPLTEIERISGNYNGMLTFQQGEVNQESFYYFYIENEKGLMQRRKLSTEKTYLGICEGDPYLKIVWVMQKYKNTSEYLQFDSEPYFIGFSQYADKGRIKEIVIYAPDH